MSQQIALERIDPQTCYVPKTHKGTGRRNAVTPGQTAARFLHYGRITLGPNSPPEVFPNNDHETGLICLKGKATVKTGGETYELEQYDAVYVPRDSEIE